ncbi:MAG: type II secretion system protein [Planctomycetota bacterium]
MPNRRHPPTGQSLIETVTAIVVIGILAGVAAPKMLSTQNECDVEATFQQLKTMTLALELYYDHHGQWPEDAVRGVTPSGIDEFLRPSLFAQTPPIGGEYDYEPNKHGVTAAITVKSLPLSTAAELAEIDARYDDGDRDTGAILRRTSSVDQQLVFLAVP